MKRNKIRQSSGLCRMARSRNLKPGFFHNEYLVELPPETRLLFAGLPCIADRLGLLEDRPKKIKMLLFPADTWDIDAMLDSLQSSGFILRYQSGAHRYIQIINFLKHQNPHKDEKESTIPEPCKHDASTVQEPDKPSPNPALTFNPITDSLNPVDWSNDFDRWWSEYPKKVGKKPALAIWKRIKPDADLLITDIQERLAGDSQWREGFIPNPTTYLNQERWNDEVQKKTGNGTAFEDPDRQHHPTYDPNAEVVIAEGINPYAEDM